MNIVKFNPVWARTLSPFWDEDSWPEVTMTEGIDVYEKDSKVIVEVAVPGVPEENIDITYEDGVLHISGKYEDSQEEKKQKKIVYKNQLIRSFDYRTVMPRPVDPSKIVARVKNGVLIVEAEIAPEAKAKKIKVSTN